MGNCQCNRLAYCVQSFKTRNKAELLQSLQSWLGLTKNKLNRDLAYRKQPKYKKEDITNEGEEDEYYYEYQESSSEDDLRTS